MRLSYLLLLVCLAAAAPAWAAVSVTHADPNRFTDVEDRNSFPEQVMRELKAHLEGLGPRYLSPEANIQVEVFDVDRAGRPRMGRGDLRIMTGRSDFPCIDLAAGLAGATQKRERVCDLDYLRSLPPPYNSGESLAFEKRMLDVWFKNRFGDASRRK